MLGPCLKICLATKGTKLMNSYSKQTTHLKLLVCTNPSSCPIWYLLSKYKDNQVSTLKQLSPCFWLSDNRQCHFESKLFLELMAFF